MDCKISAVFIAFLCMMYKLPSFSPDNSISRLAVNELFTRIDMFSENKNIL